jgi:hypothetical protein
MKSVETVAFGSEKVRIISGRRAISDSAQSGNRLLPLAFAQ